MSDPFNSRSSRRNFLAASAGGAAAFYCTIGNQNVSLEKAGDASKADAAASQVQRPRFVTSKSASRAAAAGTAVDPVDKLSFGRPEPAPGGKYVEYWIRARTVKWTIVPTKMDAWHGTPVPGASTFKAVCYQRMSDGFATAIGPPSIPGPTLYAEEGDVIVCHFRNELTDLNQAVTMHPHGVKYTPDYDGVYLGDLTRIGGYIGPGEEFTYRWEARSDSVGVWPYHDHGPNHTLNVMRGLFGSIIVRPKGAPAPDNETVLFFHSFDPPVTGLARGYQCINGRAFAGNTPTIRAKVGQDVAFHIIGMNNDFHDFHIHGHRWKSDAGVWTDNPAVGPNETITARFVEDNPGRWLYHCHVFAHQDGGMTGYYLVDP